MGIQMMPLGNCLPVSIIRRTTHHKENHTNLEWVNPCGGNYVMQLDKSLSRGSLESGSISASVSIRRHAYKILRKSIRANSQNLWGGHKEHKSIITSDITEWFSLNGTYKFLSQIKNDVKIALMTWHRDVQIYTGAFQYLHEKQKNLEELSNDRGKHISTELQTLLKSAKLLLCEIETAINQTNHRLPKILKEKEMSRRLEFRSKHLKSNDVDQIDLKFSKARYYEYMIGLNRALSKWLREHRRPLKTGAGSSNQRHSNSSLNSSMSSTGSQERRNRNRLANRRHKMRKHSSQQKH